MPFYIRKVPVLLMAILFLSTAMSCRGGSSSVSVDTTAADKAVGAREKVVSAFSTIFQTFGPTLVIALDPEAEPVKVTTISPTEELRDYIRQILCSPEGSGSVDGRVDDKISRGTFAVEIDFFRCAGVDGLVNAVGSFDRTPSEADLKWAYDGTAKIGSCSMDLSQLTVDSTASLTTPALADSLVTGLVTATCPADTGTSSVSCTWNGLAVADSASLLAGCLCTGPGC